ncbi:MAG: antibiotic biosynthesis monooxygenase [Ferruginibacter sp.]
MKANKISIASKTVLAAALLSFTISGCDTEKKNSNQPSDSNVVTRMIRYEVKAEYQSAFQKKISDYISYSLDLESNILSEAYYEQDKDTVLWIIERWDNKTALEKISNSIPFETIDTLSKNGLAAPIQTFYMKDLEPLSKQQWRTWPGKTDKPITIMLFVDSKPGTENNFREVYHAAMPEFRSEPGVINYQLSQSEDDSSLFVTYEKFRNEEAFQYHLNFPPIKPVIDYLNTSIKKQPFQTGLHRLIEFAPLTSK